MPGCAAIGRPAMAAAAELPGKPEAGARNGEAPRSTGADCNRRGLAVAAGDSLAGSGAADWLPIAAACQLKLPESWAPAVGRRWEATVECCTSSWCCCRC